MSPGARRRRAAKRRKLGPTRLQRERTRERLAAERRVASRDPRAIRGRNVRATFTVDGQEVTLENASFYGIDRSVAPERLSGWSASFTSHHEESGPLHFTTDHSTPWESLWHAVADPRTPIHPDNYANLDRELRGYPPNAGDDRVDAINYGLRAGVQSIPPRHAMSQGAAFHRAVLGLNRAHVHRGSGSLFSRCARLRSELNDLLTTPDGFSIA